MPDSAPPSHCQENLLLSVLPAHISMGMKLAIIERLKEHRDRRYPPDNNFHSLYVKRHQNVRWAAILRPSPGVGGPAQGSDVRMLAGAPWWEQARPVGRELSL